MSSGGKRQQIRRERKSTTRASRKNIKGRMQLSEWDRTKQKPIQALLGLLAETHESKTQRWNKDEQIVGADGWKKTGLRR